MRTICLRALFAVALAAGLAGCATAPKTTFETAAVGTIPPGWLSQITGAGDPKWSIEKDDSAASRLVRWLEFLLRPRLGFFHEQTIYRRTAGTLIMLSGLLLLLPLPIPLTNSLPALTVVLLAAGALERDGLFFLAGCAAFAVAAAYFGLLGFGGAHVVDELRHNLFGV